MATGKAQALVTAIKLVEAASAAATGPEAQDAESLLRSALIRCQAQKAKKDARPHVVLSTRYGGGPEVDEDKCYSNSVKAKEMFEGFGCTVYNPNTDCPQDIPELQWLERYQMNLHEAAESCGFLVQLTLTHSPQSSEVVVLSVHLVHRISAIATLIGRTQHCGH